MSTLNVNDDDSLGKFHKQTRFRTFDFRWTPRFVWENPAKALLILRKRLSISLSSFCLGEIDDLVHISPDELNADPISGIKTFKPPLLNSQIHLFVKGLFYRLCCSHIECHDYTDDQEGRHWQGLKT
jgi:hypothetical protein